MKSDLNEQKSKCTQQLLEVDTTSQDYPTSPLAEEKCA